MKTIMRSWHRELKLIEQKHIAFFRGKRSLKKSRPHASIDEFIILLGNSYCFTSVFRAELPEEIEAEVNALAGRLRLMPALS